MLKKEKEKKEPTTSQLNIKKLQIYSLKSKNLVDPITRNRNKSAENTQKSIINPLSNELGNLEIKTKPFKMKGENLIQVQMTERIHFNRKLKNQCLEKIEKSRRVERENLPHCNQGSSFDRWGLGSYVSTIYLAPKFTPSSFYHNIYFILLLSLFILLPIN